MCNYSTNITQINNALLRVVLVCIIKSTIHSTYPVFEKYVYNWKQKTVLIIKNVHMYRDFTRDRCTPPGRHPASRCWTYPETGCIIRCIIHPVSESKQTVLNGGTAYTWYYLLVSYHTSLLLWQIMGTLWVPTLTHQRHQWDTMILSCKKYLYRLH